MNSFLRTLALVSVMVAHALAQGPPRVVSTAGTWTSGGTLVIRGSRLAVNSTLETSGPGELLVECSEDRHFVYSCSKACEFNACSAGPTPDVKVQTVKVGATGFWQALIAREPKQFVVAAARAGGNLSDALLVHDATGVHWAPAFARVLEGRYCLRLAPLTTGGSSQPTTVTVAWDRAVDAEGIAQSEVKPGLYRAEKGAPGAANSCQVDSDGVPAWVLLAAPSQFESLSTQWKQYQQSAGELERANVAPSIVATFRQAALASLADSQSSR